VNWKRNVSRYQPDGGFLIDSTSSDLSSKVCNLKYRNDLRSLSILRRPSASTPMIPSLEVDSNSPLIWVTFRLSQQESSAARRGGG
jgi:hypothetical protein